MLCLLFGSFAKQQQIYDAANTLPAHFPTISWGAFEWIFGFKCNLQAGPQCYQKPWDQFVDLSADPTRSRTPVMSRRNESKDGFLMKIHPPVMSAWNSSKLQRSNRWLNVRIDCANYSALFAIKRNEGKLNILCESFTVPPLQCVSYLGVEIRDIILK